MECAVEKLEKRKRRRQRTACAAASKRLAGTPPEATYHRVSVEPESVWLSRMRTRQHQTVWASVSSLSVPAKHLPEVIYCGVTVFGPFQFG